MTDRRVLQPHDDDFRLVRIETVLDLTGFRSRQSVYDLVKRGEIPQPVKIGKRASAWRLADIKGWIETRRVDPLARPVSIDVGKSR